jgi:polyferredoxin
MDKIGYPRGLVKYSTQNAMNNKWSKKQMLHHILRPRVIIYSTILGLIVTGFLTSLWLRTPFRLDVVRDRGVMSRLTSDGKLENVYRLQIMNGTEEVQHYQVSVSGLNGLEVEADDSNKVNDDKKYNGTILVAPAEARWITVDLRIPDGTVQPGAHKIMFKIESVESRQSADEKSIFLVPRV